MKKKIKIYCGNLGRNIECEGADTLLDIVASEPEIRAMRPICARVNNKTESLDYAVYGPKTVTFLDRCTASGPRVYTRSLCMLLYRAVVAVCPAGTKLRMEHSISHGYYCRLKAADGSTCHPDKAMADALLCEMRRLVAADLPFETHEAPTAEVVELFRSQNLLDKTMLLETTRQPYTVYHTLDGISDCYYGALAPSTAHIDVFDLLPYGEGLLLLPFDPSNPSVAATPVTQQKMYRAFTDYVEFNTILGIENVGELNRYVEKHRAADLINVAEALHEKSLARISDEISRRYAEGGARVVLIAGPSSSGKTTTTKRLAIQLMTNLLKPEIISLDNYFVDRTRTPLDESGDYDYESLYALDLEAFNSDLNRIIAGEEVPLPTYNFETGTRQYKGNTIKLSDKSILLIEGIHGLNPELTAHIEEKMKFRVYVSALTTLSIDDHNWVPTTDNRLLRRIIRDFKYRGTSAEESIRRWPSVRRGEEKWIFPYQENADATFNSSLLFELGVMKDYAENVLRHVHADVPEYAEAYRLRKFLSYFLPIPANLIPSTSLLREFLGGSSFKY